MYESIHFSIEGISPLMLHNGQLANPLNQFSKALKAVSGKRKKTDSDYADMSKIEFMGGLYVNDKGQPVFPGENIEAAIIEGARKQKLGQNAQAGVISDGSWPIIYEGPKTWEKLWEEESFRDIRKVKVQQSSVMRTRPIFRKWRLEFDVQYLPDQLNRAQVVDIVKTVGRSIGIGDYTPKFGRFEVLKAA